jgi:hypothetical protein
MKNTNLNISYEYESTPDAEDRLMDIFTYLLLGDEKNDENGYFPHQRPI